MKYPLEPVFAKSVVGRRGIVELVDGDDGGNADDAAARQMSLYDLQAEAWKRYQEAGGVVNPESARRLAKDVEELSQSHDGQEVLARLSSRFSLLAARQQG
jgi:hypothetical protein